MCTMYCTLLCHSIISYLQYIYHARHEMPCCCSGDSIAALSRCMVTGVTYFCVQCIHSLQLSVYPNTALDRAAAPPPPYYIEVGFDVGWRRRCNTRLSLRELDSQGTVVFCFRRLPRLAVELDHFCVGRTFSPHKGIDRTS